MIRLLSILILIKELESNYSTRPIILNKFTIFIYFYTFINSDNSIISFINLDFTTLYYYLL